MIFSREKWKFYTLGSDLNLHEVRRFYLKMASIICVTTLLAVGFIIGLNQITGNFLGFGSDELNRLSEENAVLKKKITSMNDLVAGLRSSIDQIENQGDELRLMVDLPPVDPAVKEAGTGGSSVPELMSFNLPDGTEDLSQVENLLSRMSGELKIQEQNYSQILKKYEANKAYFAALPALKPMQGLYSAYRFGMRMHPILGVMKNHKGLDIHGNVGTKVVASGDGIVAMAGHSGGGYGNIVVINHGYGYQTLYAHLSKVLVRPGKRVERGDLIARSGRSGLVSGPHLHYEVRRNGISMDPTDFFYDDIEGIVDEDIAALYGALHDRGQTPGMRANGFVDPHDRRVRPFALHGLLDPGDGLAVDQVVSAVEAVHTGKDKNFLILLEPRAILKHIVDRLGRGKRYTLCSCHEYKSPFMATVAPMANPMRHFHESKVC